jgi:ribonuclease R
MTKKKKQKQTVTFNKKFLKSELIGLFYENPQKIFNYRQLNSLLGIADRNTARLTSVVLDELADSGRLEQVQRGRYKLKAGGNSVTGKVEISRGQMYVNSDEVNGLILIAPRYSNHALEGDTVRVSMFAARPNHPAQGEIKEVIERAKTTFVGIIERSAHFAFLVPVGKAGCDMFIAPEKLNSAKDGQKVVGRIIDWPDHSRNPYGEVIEILGAAGENETEMHAILAEYNLPLHFPDSVLKAAARIPARIPEKEISMRRDMRGIPTFTIDPEDAKDFDDALSIRSVGDNLWEVGVHIADVSYYIKPDTILDKEAYNRATSVYLVDRVVPMLPEKLSNGLCSLRPNEDKLCFSAIFTLNSRADVVDSWFGRTVIRSIRRFSYEEAQQVIETGTGDLTNEILTLDKLSKVLRTKRFRMGSISFERAEVKFRLDENGKPLSVYFKEASDSNMLIEEFMLLANKRVAELIGNPPDKRQPRVFVYRVHDQPDPEKLSNFNHFIRKFGYRLETKNPDAIASSMNVLLEQVKGRTEQNVVESLAIRSMAKAEYSTRNIGHYGLGFRFYTHFTSPIRRYPDVMVHRLLARYLDGGRSVNAQKFEEYCKHSSKMEMLATAAERSSVKYKQVEFMEDKVGQVFDGTISGITDWGLYVELDNKCEGMVPLREMDDDFYFFDEQNYCLVGRRTHFKYQLGDSVKVEVHRANLEKKQLDFRLV